MSVTTGDPEFEMGVPLRLHLKWWLVLLAFPLLAAQGWHTRRNTVRLPDAAGPAHGHVQNGERSSGHPETRPLRVALLGDSTVSGVGAEHHGEGLSGQLAVELGGRLQRDIQWRAVGENGIRVRDVRTRLVPELNHFEPDLVVVALGVNDTTALTALGTWQDELIALLEAIFATGAAGVVFNSVPHMGLFIGVPQPLRGVLGLRSRMLDRVLKKVIADDARTGYVQPRFPLESDCMAEDGYHPSARGYRIWAEQLAEQVAERVSAPVSEPF